MASSSPIPILYLLLLFPTISTNTSSKTFFEDTEALKAIKLAIEPTSITPGSCLASWDFAADPCDALSSDRFTCGLRCDARTADGLARVTELTLDATGYSGSLSPSIWSLAYLETLDLHDNRFFGPVPPPPPAAVLGRLRRLILSRNFFSDSIPDLSSAAPSLEELSLDGNFFTGPIGSNFTALRRLNRLEVQMNNLTGEIPDLSSLSSLFYLDASDNVLSGNLPSNLPASLVEVSLRNNRLTGDLLGSTVAALTALQVMDLSHNGLSGAVPASVFEHPALEQVTLSHNGFESVEEPADGGLGSGLVALDLGYNRIRGYLPGFLGSMPRLSAVTLEENGFTGMIPAQYAVRAAGMGGEGAAPFGRLVLSGNYLFGPIPSPMGGLEEGSAVVSLADNCLFRCPKAFFFCQGGEQKPEATCRDFNPVIP